MSQKRRGIFSIIPHPFGAKMALQEALELARNRILLTVLAIFVGFGVIGTRMTNIAMQNSDEALYTRSAKAGFKSDRADIIDRNGEILATSVLTSSLFADARVVIDPEQSAEKLLTVLPYLKKKDVLRRLQSKKAFIWLARHLTPKQKAEVLKLGIPGLDFRRDYRRIYPYGALTSHVTGFTGIDGNGLYGIEKQLDREIRTSDEPIQMSMDIRLQHILVDELHQSVEKFDAIGACGLILDIKTGEVLAMASLPDYDPNHPVNVNDPSMFNRVTLGVYEQGSIFKIFNTTIALETKVVNLDSKFDATQPLQVGKFKVTDYRGKNTWLSTEEIFLYSSNIGSAKMALLFGGEKQKAFFNKLGFFKSKRLELPEIGAPLYPTIWKEANTITASYGYGVAVTPLHVASAVGGIVNDGYLIEPTLLKRDGIPSDVRQVVSANTSQAIRGLMRKMVVEGSGGKAKVAGVHIGGKSGTTNYRKSQGRGYQKKDVRTAFVGVFPKSPRYVVYVMLEKPNATKETYGFNAAGWNAAPLCGSVVKRIAPLLGLTPEMDVQEAKPNDVKVVSFREG